MLQDHNSNNPLLPKDSLDAPLVEMWNRSYRNDELRLYLDGYLAALRHSNARPYLIHRLEEEATRSSTIHSI